MSIVKPFRAFRPQAALVKQVASQPYDVLNSEEARHEAHNNPLSFLHVTKSEIDLPSGVDVHSDAVYEKARENFERLVRDGVLFQEPKPCYYIYELVMNGKSQTGLVCLSSVDDYYHDQIKKHEFTRPEKEKDRIDHMLAIRAQTGNVFLAYRDVDRINELIEKWKTKDPEYDFTAEDDVRHRVWKVDDDTAIRSITEMFQRLVPATYIADGHHRAASAAKVQQALPANEHAKYFLTTIFPASQLAIWDYNRLVKDLNGLSKSQLLEKLATNFSVERSTSPVKPALPHQFGMYIDHEWFKLQAKDGSYNTDPIGVLDVTILSDNILRKLLGIADQRTDKRIDFVGGIRGLAELEKRVDSGEMKLAFTLYPVSISQLFEIADTGNVMPPKSTWFEPKLRDGLLTHSLA